MKKLFLLFFLAVACIDPVSGQAFNDVQKINAIVNRGFDNESGKELSEIILPYFTFDGVVQRDKIKKYFTGKIGESVLAYLDTKINDLAAIERLNKSIELKAFFDKIYDSLEKLNKIKDSEPGKLIPNIPATYTFSTVTADYRNVEFELKLRKLDSLQKAVADTTVMTEADKAVLLLKVTDAQTGLSIGALKADILLSTIQEIKRLITSINQERNQILKIVKENKRLSGILINDGNPDNRISNLDFDRLKGVSTEIAIRRPDGSQMSALSAFKLPTQSEMIESLVIFISKRFSQEVAITFIESIKKRAKTMELVSELFPTTIKLLMEGNAYEVPKLGSVWHYAIAQDLNKLPARLSASTYIKNKIVGLGLDNYYLLFQDVVTMGELAKNGNSLPEITILLRSNLYPINNPTLKLGFEVINLINQELSTIPELEINRRFWVKWTDLNRFTNSDWDVFIKLIASKYNSSIFSKDGFDLSFDKFDDNKWQAFKSTIQKALILLNQFEDRRLLKIEANVALNNQIKTLSFWECQQELFTILLNESLISNPGIRRPLGFINNGIQIYRLQEQGNYPAMLREAIQLVNEMLPQQSARLNELIVKNWRANKDIYLQTARELDVKITPLNTLYLKLIDPANKGKHLSILKSFAIENAIPAPKIDSEDDFLDSIALELITRFNKVKDAKHVLAIDDKNAIKKILAGAIGNENRNFAYDPDRSKSNLSAVLKTAEFFTDVMSAGDSKQLAEVIEAYAMPPASYKVRRNTRYSVDLDAYVGLYGGAEYLGSGDHANIKKLAPVWGLSAPIGISFAWGKRRVTKAGEVASFLNSSGIPKTLIGNSFSIGVSLLDIAAPLAFRLSNDAEEALPKNLSWSQLFSPGLHLRWGIKNTPLCFSMGAQYTPQLRRMDEPITKQQAYRAYAGLFFDLPLFNIYRR